MSDEQRSGHLVGEFFDVVELVTHDVELPEAGVLVADSKLEAFYLGLLNACGIDLDLPWRSPMVRRRSSMVAQSLRMVSLAASQSPW